MKLRRPVFTLAATFIFACGIHVFSFGDTNGTDAQDTVSTPISKIQKLANDILTHAVPQLEGLFRDQIIAPAISNAKSTKAQNALFAHWLFSGTSVAPGANVDVIAWTVVFYNTTAESSDYERSALFVNDGSDAESPMVSFVIRTADSTRKPHAVIIGAVSVKEQNKPRYYSVRREFAVVDAKWHETGAQVTHVSNH